MADLSDKPADFDLSKETDIDSLSDHKNQVFLINYSDKTQLYDDYMPYIRGGALFVPTEKNYTLNDEVYLLVNLLDEPEKYPVAGIVIWITPRCAQGRRLAGIGVQFVNEEAKTLRTRIEDYLAGMLGSSQGNHTM